MGTRKAVQSRSGVSAAWCPLQRSRLMPSRTHSSNLHVIHTCCYENIVYIPDRVIFGHPYRSTIMEWRLRRVVPASAVSTHAKPHARQQLARDLEVERAVMGRRCRPHRFSEVLRGNSSATSMAGFLLNCSSVAVRIQKMLCQRLRLACREIKRWFAY